ncbi:MAG: hydrogenase, partial [Aeromonas sp.]
KICIAYGACGCDGGIFHDAYCVWGGTDKIVPVDVYIPGCPPTPAATIYGFAVALGLLEQKLSATSHDVDPGSRVELRHTGIPNEIRVMIEREARRMAGYRQGRIIADEFMALLEGATSADVDARIKAYLDRHNDPRLGEIVNNLAFACLNRPAAQGEPVHG